MIDWMTTKIKCNTLKPINGGYVVALTQNKELEWKTEKNLIIEGSHSSTILIKSLSDTEILISGNPVKFLQGHNIFGTNDINALFNAFFKKLCTIQELGLIPTFNQSQAIRQGEYDLFRVDINETIHFKTSEDAQSFINSVGTNGTMAMRGRGQFSGDTVYFGKNSRRWSIKLYHKGSEIKKKGRLHSDFKNNDKLVDYANKAVRIEVVMRSMELKRLGLNIAKNFSKSKVTEVFSNYLSGLNVMTTLNLSDDVFNSLKPALKAAYTSWQAGKDLKTIYPRNTYYRYAKIFKSYGIDVSVLNPDTTKNIIHFQKVLEMQFVGIPDWAEAEGLLALL